MLTTSRGLELLFKLSFCFLRFSLKILYNTVFINYEKYALINIIIQ